MKGDLRGSTTAFPEPTPPLLPRCLPAFYESVRGHPTPLCGCATPPFSRTYWYLPCEDGSPNSPESINRERERGTDSNTMPWPWLLEAVRNFCHGLGNLVSTS